jgi:hypothetical protein
MTRLPTKYLDTVDLCVRCPPDRPTVAPDGLGSSTDAASVVLLFRCPAGHCWQRAFRRADLTHRPAKAGAARRRHVATRSATTTTPAGTITTNDNADEAHMSRAARQPSPWTCWNPDRRTWQAR